MWQALMTWLFENAGQWEQTIKVNKTIYANIGGKWTHFHSDNFKPKGHKRPSIRHLTKKQIDALMRGNHVK